MNSRTRDHGASATELLKLVAVALLLAIVVSAGRSAMMPLLADRSQDRTALERQATQVAYRHAATYIGVSEADPEDPL